MAPSIRLALTLPPLQHVPARVEVLRDLLGAVALSILPAGGQRVARRNAWAGMSTDAARARARREADRALDAAHARAHARARAVLPAAARRRARIAGVG